ncbi:MAG: hypothetical protein ABW034_21100 [Steroidobacteraceae bacterium]
MLTPQDESLLHQAALPFSQTTTTDHRFYDRVFFAVFDPAGAASVMMGMGLYKNMNVIDAFSCVVRNGKQYNIRASRPLRPDLSTSVGPIRFEVLEAYKSLRFSVAPGDYDVALDLTWSSDIMPFLEERWEGNFKVVNGRVATDTQRFDGIGRWNGWIQVGRERLEVKDWCGGRDHSWGTRGGVGGFEPVNGESHAPKEGWFLGYFVYGDGKDMAGYTLWTEDGQRNFRSFEGTLRWREALGKPDLRLVSVDREIVFPPDRRQFKSAHLTLRGADGSTWKLDCDTPIPGTILKGYGGHGEGFKDKKGFGVYRGNLVEHDVYDLSSPDMVGLPVEQPLIIKLNGKPGYYGWGTILAIGELKQYGLRQQTQEELHRYSIAVDNLKREE